MVHSAIHEKRNQAPSNQIKEKAQSIRQPREIFRHSFISFPFSRIRINDNKNYRQRERKRDFPDPMRNADEKYLEKKIFFSREKKKPIKLLQYSQRKPGLAKWSAQSWRNRWKFLQNSWNY